MVVRRRNDTQVDAPVCAAVLPCGRAVVRTCQIHGFGEGALLSVIRRRFLEQYKIYTYVGDILIVVNPYMLMEENIHIETPAKAYQVGWVWLVGCWLVWSVGRSVGRLVGWLVGWLVD